MPILGFECLEKKVVDVLIPPSHGSTLPLGRCLDYSLKHGCAYHNKHVFTQEMHFTFRLHYLWY